jgi:hypothetical protein
MIMLKSAIVTLRTEAWTIIIIEAKVVTEETRLMISKLLLEISASAGCIQVNTMNSAPKIEEPSSLSLLRCSS